MATEKTNWIWSSDWVHEDKKQPRIVYFRKEISLDSDVRQAGIQITADTRYKLYINERLVEVGPSKGDQEVWFVDTIDLAPYLQEGTNVFSVIVLRYPLERREGCHSMFRSELPGLYLTGLIQTQEETLMTLSADETWMSYIDRSIQFPPEETDFAPLIIHEKAGGNPECFGWMRRGFAHSSWKTAQVYSSGQIHEAIAPGNINPRTIPFLYRKRRNFTGLIEGEPEVNGKPWYLLLAGKGIIEIPAYTTTRVVLHAGEEMTGYLRMAFAKGAHAKVRLLEAECYVQDEISPTSGTPIKKDRLDAVYGHLEGYVDCYEVAGLGTPDIPETYEPFWFRTFRLIELTITTEEEPLEILRLDYEETGYPLEVKTKVETSDPSLKDIWDLSERTLRRCMHETYEDCPFYEQLQYTMDTRAQILFTYATAADDRLARKAIDDFSRAQRSNGLLNCSYPNMNPNVIPGFSIYYILMVHDHMMYFGDEALVRRYIPTIDKILNYFDRHLTPEGLVDKVGGILNQSRYWSFVDWTPQWNPTEGMPTAGIKGPITMESLLYVYGLQMAAELASYIGRIDTAHEYLERATAVQRAIRKYCRREDGMITDGPGIEDASQHGQVFGILTQTLDRKSGRENLLKTIQKAHSFPQCTVAMQFYLFRAMEETGLYEYTDQYWNLWRIMLSYGCTTSIESEDYARSECHAWGALALYELPSAILGVRPAAPGYQKIAVSPHAEYLTFASGTVHTPVGEVRVSWKKDEKRLELHVDAPEGVEVIRP